MIGNEVQCNVLRFFFGLYFFKIGSAACNVGGNPVTADGAVLFGIIGGATAVGRGAPVFRRYSVYMRIQAIEKRVPGGGGAAVSGNGAGFIFAFCSFVAEQFQLNEDGEQGSEF